MPPGPPPSRQPKAGRSREATTPSRNTNAGINPQLNSPTNIISPAAKAPAIRANEGDNQPSEMHVNTLQEAIDAAAVVPAAPSSTPSERNSLVGLPATTGEVSAPSGAANELCHCARDDLLLHCPSPAQGVARQRPHDHPVRIDARRARGNECERPEARVPGRTLQLLPRSREWCPLSRGTPRTCVAWMSTHTRPAPSLRMSSRTEHATVGTARTMSMSRHAHARTMYAHTALSRRARRVCAQRTQWNADTRTVCILKCYAARRQKKPG